MLREDEVTMAKQQPDPNDVDPDETLEHPGQWDTIEPPTTQPERSSLDDEHMPRRIGPYVLETRLGSGGFGEVWLAKREGEFATTRLAVKLPHTSRVDLVAVRQEAGLWARIGSHPNILPIFEATVYDGQVVIVSEYAADGSLTEWLKRHGGKAPTPDEAARICLGILAGLEHLHTLDIIHRDIKPANVLLQSGVPRLVDFGVSRMLHTDDPTGLPAGTPAFMAPEAFDGVRSTQTDIWSVGVLFYLLLAGVLPFPEREWMPLLKSILTRDPPVSPPDIPDIFAEILRKSLAKDPDRRYRSAWQMADGLKSALAERSAARGSVRLLAHIAAFVGTARHALFVNATNLSETVDREVTHVWIETDRQIHLSNKRRPLPKRLKPQETWETWIELLEIPADFVNETLPTLARA
jgi:serine/threonine protein kinase